MILQFITQYSLQIIIALPIFMTIIFYQIHYWINKKQWLAIHFSTQASSMFYLIAVSIIVDTWLPFRSIGYILISILLILSILVIMQWKKDTEIKIKHAFKILLRILFLFLSLISLYSLFIVQSCSNHKQNA